MAHQISKFPLTAEQLRKNKLPLPPKIMSVTFKKCGHPAKIFDGAEVNLEGYCWGCQKR